jgi:hypothetical protein
MIARVLAAGMAVTAVAVTATPASAAASWPASGVGRTSAKAGTLLDPTTVTTTACTATGKGSGNVTVSVTITWVKSASTQATGQKVYRGSTLVQTIANNTTQTLSPSFTVAPGTYTMGVAATVGTNWSSDVAPSNNTFTVSTAGTNGTCTRSS